MTNIAAVLVLGLSPSLANDADQAACEPGALGVSRVIELDTLGGQLYGNAQYVANSDLLADKEVVLTFDDGPSPDYTKPILDALDAECAKATFFVVGRMAMAYQSILRETASRGHTIGNHTWSHALIRKLNLTRGQEELERGISMVTAVLGHPPAPFFRFPYLDDPIAQINYLKARDFGIFSIDVDSFDSHGQAVSKEKIIYQTISGLKKKGKGIVLMHDIKKQTAAALPEILRQLKDHGFKLVHIVSKRPAETLPKRDAEAQTLLKRFDAVRLAQQGVPDPLVPLSRSNRSLSSLPSAAVVTDAKLVAKVAPGSSMALAARSAHGVWSAMQNVAEESGHGVVTAALPEESAKRPAPVLRPSLTGDEDVMVMRRLRRDRAAAARRARQIARAQQIEMARQQRAAAAEAAAKQSKTRADAGAKANAPKPRVVTVISVRPTARIVPVRRTERQPTAAELFRQKILR